MTSDQLTHPAWCDARLCDDLGADRNHRSIALEWCSHDHVAVTVGLSQLDNPVLDDRDSTLVALALDDTDARVVVELHPHEARELADRLYAEAGAAEIADRKD